MNRRFRLAAAGVVVLLVAVASAALVLGGGGDALGSAPRSATLAPLPAGAPSVTDGHASMQRRTVADMVKDADVVFIGRAIDKGGSESVSPEEPGISAGLTAHRIRFDVKTVLRGEMASPTDVSTLDLGAELDPYEIGKTYLVFGHFAELGTTKTPALITDGYQQGAFRLTGSERAENPENGEIDIREIAKRLKEGN